MKECVGACKCIMCFRWYENVYDWKSILRMCMVVCVTAYACVNV